MSQKPHKAPGQDKKQRKRKKKTKQTLTRAVAHIRLIETNPGKLAALDQMMAVYLPLCQRYVTRFCTADTVPDKYGDPVFETELSDRLHRVAIQQAAGIAKSWRTNRENAYQAYLQDVVDYVQAKARAEAEDRMSAFKRKEPIWNDWNVPVLRVPVIQANANVVVVEPSKESTFDYWLRVSTLDKGAPLRIPVKLAPYHKAVLKDRTLNTSTTLYKRKGVWWLTLSFDEDVPLQTEPSASVVGVDVGIAHFITTSTHKEYGSFHGKMARQHRRDREKRRRKAKLRACLEKKGVPKDKLPSTSSATSQRLSRHVRQEINRAVNELIQDHPHARLIYENLDVASMRFHARSMNAYLYASQLGHIPEQLTWAAAKKGIAAHAVAAAYSSQECPRCRYVDRANRPTQQTFSCVVCGYQDHADHKAAQTLAGRWGDKQLAGCRDKKEIKALLMTRHEAWKKENHQWIKGAGPLVQSSFWDSRETLLDTASG